MVMSEAVLGHVTAEVVPLFYHLATAYTFRHSIYFLLLCVLREL